MSICACCDRPLEPEWAEENKLCPVCFRSKCTAFHAKHTSHELALHEENKVEQRRREYEQETINA